MKKYKYIETMNEGNLEILVEEKYFATRKDARAYLNSRVKEVRNNNKAWRTYFQNNSQIFFEKELRLAEHIKQENEGTFDIGDCNVYYSFEVELLD